MASGADALILDLEDSVSAGPQGRGAGDRARPSCKTRAAQDGPRLIVRVNALDTGLTDDDLDAVVAGQPDAIMLPKAEGGASVTHLRRQALRARGDRTACPTARSAIVALATETAAALFTRRHLRRFEPAP